MDTTNNKKDINKDLILTLAAICLPSLILISLLDSLEKIFFLEDWNPKAYDLLIFCINVTLCYLPLSPMFISHRLNLDKVGGLSIISCTFAIFTSLYLFIHHIGFSVTIFFYGGVYCGMLFIALFASAANGAPEADSLDEEKQTSRRLELFVRVSFGFFLLSIAVKFFHPDYAEYHSEDLLGEDLNGNFIRDDFERWVDSEYKDINLANAFKQAAVFHYFAIKHSESAESKELINKFDNAFECARSFLNKSNFSEYGKNFLEERTREYVGFYHSNNGKSPYDSVKGREALERNIKVYVSSDIVNKFQRIVERKLNNTKKRKDHFIKARKSGVYTLGDKCYFKKGIALNGRLLGEGIQAQIINHPLTH